MESIFFTSFLLLFLFQCSKFGMLRSILPVVNNIFTSYNYMSLAHSYILRLNRDVLVVNWASNCITKYNNPLTFFFFNLCNENTVFSTSDNFLKPSHILYVFFINDSIPKDHTHIVSLRLAESKD